MQILHLKTILSTYFSLELRWLGSGLKSIQRELNPNQGDRLPHRIPCQQLGNGPSPLSNRTDFIPHRLSIRIRRDQGTLHANVLERASIRSRPPHISIAAG
jgi:hypothetical protein